MSVPKKLIKNVLLTVADCGSISSGGVTYSKLTNRDGTKKRNGWGVS